MNFIVNWLAFYLIETPSDDAGSKQIRLTRMLTQNEYEKSELRLFLDGEFAKIAKRKVEVNPKSEGSPTKLGQFILAEGHGLDSNPNYAAFRKLLSSADIDEVRHLCHDLVNAYLRTSQVRGGVLLLVKARMENYSDEFLFLLKCDFEQKTAVITDETSLISNVQMAINAKNMKSIMFPLLLEEGMTDEYHVKIHQFSHARYFEEFLKYIEYPQTVAEIVSHEVVSLAKQHIEMQYPEQPEVRQREEEEIELLAASPKRELAEKWEHETVLEAAQIITDRQPEVELQVKLDHMHVRAQLLDYGQQVHIAKFNGRYVVLLEGDVLQFEKGFSPIELLKPKNLHDILTEIEQREARSAHTARDGDDTPPW